MPRTHTPFPALTERKPLGLTVTRGVSKQNVRERGTFFAALVFRSGPLFVMRKPRQIHFESRAASLEGITGLDFLSTSHHPIVSGSLILLTP